MNEIGIYWNLLLVNPILNLLVFFYKAFEYFHIPGPLGFAVIALTLVTRLVLYPLTHTQLKSAKKMANLKPHLDALGQKHKDDKKALQQAQLDLYKEHGVNPAAGCLPLLAQFPVLIALYGVFNQVLVTNQAKVISEINKIIYSPSLKLTAFDLTFLGANLAWKPSQFQEHGWWLLTIPVITAGLQWYQTKLMMQTSENSKLQDANSKQITKSKASIKKTDGKDEKKPEDTAMEMQKQMAIISPLMFGYFSWQLPIGLALYWNIVGIFGIMQQLQVNKSNK